MQDKHQKFYKCEHCGNIVGMIESAGVPIFCCGEKMQELVPDSSASTEKHTPNVSVSGNKITVSLEHTQNKEHRIDWIYLRTSCGGQRKNIPCDSEQCEQPHVEFVTSEGEVPLEVFAYCNKHGLWSTKV